MNLKRGVEINQCYEKYKNKGNMLLLLTKRFQMWMICYPKLKSKYRTLLGYKFHSKFDDFYSSLCRKKL